MLTQTGANIVAKSALYGTMSTSQSEDEHVAEEEMPSEASPSQKTTKKKKKETKPGVIYLSRIPTGMNVTKIRQVFEEYGEVGRLFLQPDEKLSAHKKRRVFTEGWVEFANKKVAKSVTLALNNNKVGGKKRAVWHEELWNIKYLNRFQWGHLNERMAYEQAVRNQRLRVEISQVKKESHFFIANVEKKQRLKRLEGKQKSDEPVREWTFAQKDTEEVILAKKRKGGPGEGSGRGKMAKTMDSVKLANKPKACLNQNFLKTLFSGGVKDGDGD